MSRDPREEENLDQREVGAEEAREAGDADEDVAGAPGRQVAAVHPEGPPWKQRFLRAD